MRKTICIILFFLPTLLFAQRLQLNIFGGFSNYQGDLQGKPFTLEQSNAALGAGLSYSLTGHLLVRAGLVHGKVQADDKLNKPSLQLRNLNFQTAITEGHLLVEYDLLDISEHKFTPYAFAGVAVYHFNPYSFDSLGTKVRLQPLGTEGQGLSQYPDRKPYRLTQFSIPVGGGLKLRLSDNVTIAYEVGVRILSTDYLDDVSSTYADGTALLAGKGPEALTMAYRGDEVKNGNPVYPAAGTLRGNAKLTDWYYFHGLSLAIGLRTGGWHSRRPRYGCPVF